MHVQRDIAVNEPKGIASKPPHPRLKNMTLVLENCLDMTAFKLCLVEKMQSPPFNGANYGSVCSEEAR